jgi:hypothetical protein
VLRYLLLLLLRLPPCKHLDLCSGCAEQIEL